MQPDPKDRLGVEDAVKEIERIVASATDPASARAATIELTQVLPQRLESKIDPNHQNVMLYSGGLSGTYPTYHDLAGMKDANALAVEFSKHYKDATGKSLDGVSIIDNTDRATFLMTKEFNDNVEKLVKMYMGPDGDNPDKLRAELTEVKLNNAKAPWKVCSSDFVESAPGRNFFTAIPEADAGRVFGATELPTFVSTGTAQHMNNMPMADLQAKHAKEGNVATFDMLKQDSRETLGYMFTKVEVNVEDGKLELKPILTKEALAHMGYTQIPGAKLESGLDAAMQGAYQGLKGETGPAALAGVKEINTLTDRLQTGASMEPHLGETPTEFVPRQREAQLAAMGGNRERGGMAKGADGRTGFQREMVGLATDNVAPLKPGNFAVKDVKDGKVVAQIDAAQSRLNKVDFDLAEHPHLANAEKGDWVRCDVKNGKLESQLLKKVGAAGQTLDAAHQVAQVKGPAGAAIDAAHSAVTIGAQRGAGGGGRGGR